MAEVKTICFDLDGVICTATDGSYDKARPFPEAIAAINALYDEGYRIQIFTARYMGRTRQNVIEAYRIGYEPTRQQLTGWGLKFHDLFLGKPVYDLFIDDRAAFYRADWKAIREAVHTCAAQTAPQAI